MYKYLEQQRAQQKSRRIRRGLVLIVCLCCIVSLLLLYYPQNPEYDWTYISYRVSGGDTLWNICQEYCPEEMSLREYMILVEDINQLDSADLYVGDTLNLPIIQE